jgi:hypothetical protein
MKFHKKQIRDNDREWEFESLRVDYHEREVT